MERGIAAASGVDGGIPLPGLAARKSPEWPKSSEIRHDSERNYMRLRVV